MRSCFMFGHGDCPDHMLPRIEEAIEKQYSNLGTRCIYVGNRGNFDRLAATAAKRIKQRHPDLQLVLVLAYHPAERSVDLPDGFDHSFYPPMENTPRPYAILQANRYMTQNCDSIICYVKHGGNTRNLLEYAQRRQQKAGVIIENLAPNC